MPLVRSALFRGWANLSVIPSLPTSSLGLILNAPNVHPVLACALRGVLAADPGEVAWGLGDGWLLWGTAQMSLLMLEPALRGMRRGEGEQKHRTQPEARTPAPSPSSPHSRLPSLLAPFPLPSPPPEGKAHCVVHIGEILGQE